MEEKKTLEELREEAIKAMNGKTLWDDMTPEECSKVQEYLAKKSQGYLGNPLGGECR